jgi:hypothetical protein
LWTKRDKLFISGFPRAGTTMMLLMMKYFDSCKVIDEGEFNPILFSKVKSKKCIVIKQPFGYFEEFPPPYDYALLVSNGYNYRIISMVRDPRDVLVSKHASDLSKYWVSPIAVIRNCEEYLKNLNNPEVLFVRYEDLVTNPYREMNRISFFTGFTYRNSFTDFYKLEVATHPIHKSLNGPRKIDTYSIGNWKRKEHRRRMKEVMTDQLKDYIVKLGYTL